eukprot:8650837-Alexandrium_andersonii.AAC.1
MLRDLVRGGPGGCSPAQAFLVCGCSSRMPFSGTPRELVLRKRRSVVGAWLVGVLVGGSLGRS